MKQHTTSVRDGNMAVLLRALWRKAPLTRQDLVHYSGLDKSTVSRLTDVLITRGVVCERGVMSRPRGRPSAQLDINQQYGYVVGIELTSAGMKAVLLDLRGVVEQSLDRQQQAPSPSWVIARVSEIMSRFAASEHCQDRPILGAAISVPGMVDTEGTVFYSVPMGWQGVPLRRLLTTRFDFPVLVENDANTAGLAEIYFGCGQDARTIVFFNIGATFGCCIIVDRRIYRGADGMASRAAAMTLFGDGSIVGSRITTNAALWKAQSALAQGREGRGHPKTICTFADVVTGARQGDEVCRQALAAVGRDLGVTAVNIINLLNPELIVVGGSLASGAEYVLPAAQQVILDAGLPQPHATHCLVASTLKDDVVFKGTVALVLEGTLNIGVV